MILVIVDDLMVRSKISTAARVVGVPIAAATTADAAIARARELRPALILMDLDSVRVEPLRVLSELAADPELRAIPTLGFVSHVNAQRIREARRLGIHEVLARSAFAATLPDILARHVT